MPGNASRTDPEYGLLCSNRRCATLLDADAELCDECGGAELQILNEADALLIGSVAGRPIGFVLVAGRASIVGRSSDGVSADVDLDRLARSNSVHRRHASIEQQGTRWQITKLGRNPLIVERNGRRRSLGPGETADLAQADWVQVGAVRVEFLIGPRLHFDPGSTA